MEVLPDSIREGDLEFNFGTEEAKKLDQPGREMPIGMSFVDIVVFGQSETILIEVKDPSQIGTPGDQQTRFLKSLSTKTLIHEKLVPKARDSYTFLHLMGKTKGDIVLVVVFGFDRCNFKLDPALILTFRDRLRARLLKEAYVPWRIEYINRVIVITTQEWNKYFTDYRLSRI